MTSDSLYVVEETQTHYIIHDDTEGKYAQCPNVQARSLGA
jgi:hypothetical protein